MTIEKILVLEKGEMIKIIGQKNTYIIIQNIDGDIFNLLSKHEVEDKYGND